MGKTSKRQEAEQMREFRLRKEQEEREKKEKTRHQNRLILGILLGVLAVALIGAGIGLAVSKIQENRSDEGGSVVPEINQMSADQFAVSDVETDYVRLTVSYTDSNGEEAQGDIFIRLREDVAPITVKNFRKLVSEKFYDGLTFHRVYPGFMIQGGDPEGDGSGSASETIKGEFSANGVKNELSHVRGVVSMARSTSYNSASSQFFIMHADNTANLDGQYAAFGYVVCGMETVDGITGTELEKLSNGVDSVATSPVDPVTIVSAVFVQPIA